MARLARQSSTNTAATPSRSSSSMPRTSSPAENTPGWPEITIACAGAAPCTASTILRSSSAFNALTGGRAILISQIASPPSGPPASSGWSVTSSMRILRNSFVVLRDREKLAKHGRRETARVEREAYAKHAVGVIVREFAHANAQRAPLRVHALGADHRERFWKTRGNAFLERGDAGARHRRPFAHERRGGMDLERGQPGLEGRVRDVGREHAAASIEVRDVARAETVPGSRAYALGEDGVENETAGRGEHESLIGATASSAARASRRDRFGRRHHRGEITRASAESLRPEVVWDSARRDVAESPRQRRRVAVHATCDDVEAVAGERSTRELALMRFRPQHFEPLAR